MIAPTIATIMTTYGFTTEQEVVAFLLASFTPEPVPVVAVEESRPQRLFRKILAHIERREAKEKAATTTT